MLRECCCFATLRDIPQRAPPEYVVHCNPIRHNAVSLREKLRAYDSRGAPAVAGGNHRSIRILSMRFSIISLGALALATAATPAFAQDAAPAAPAPTPEFTFNATAAIVSDYRFRGISQTDGNFAVQAGATVTHASGFYLSFWGSSVDDYVTAHGTAHQELDLIAGFKKTFGAATFDIGALYYVYPGTRLPGDKSASDFIEPYADVAYTYGPVTGKVTVNWAPKQKALALDQMSPKLSNVYLAGDLSVAIPKTPIGLTGHLGHTWGPSWLSIGKEYTDYNVGGTFTYKNVTFGLVYADTDGDFITPSGKNASKSGVVGSVTFAF